MSTDRIEKKIVLRVPRSRVWRALTNAEEFGAWFGAKLSGSFAPAAVVKAVITSKGYEGLTFDLEVERIEPEHRLSYRWHPAAIDQKVDYSKEPTTLVEFVLDEVAGGTELTVTESGFDRLPAGRRADAFRSNSEGWAIQLTNIERYVAA